MSHSIDAPHAGSWRRARLWLVYLVYLFVIVELVSHTYWGFFRKTSLLRPNIWDCYYPEYARTGIAEMGASDGEFRVLLLGGSVMSPEYGSVGAHLTEKLTARLGRPTRVYNMAYPARTSRDSLIKYRTLGDKHFDLVVFYHGINDTYMNCCPPSMYRDDYTHCRWYAQYDVYQKLGATRWIVSPFTLYYAGMNAVEALPIRLTIGRLDPLDDWMKYGGDIKTRKAFHDNLGEIVTLAGARGDRLLVMTFAYHLPHVSAGGHGAENPNDYEAGISNVGIWGHPENVAHGIDVHNGIVKEMVRDHPDLLFVDQCALMPRDREHFHDCCHLAEKGCAAFARHIVDGVALQMRRP